MPQFQIGRLILFGLLGSVVAFASVIMSSDPTPMTDMKLEPVSGTSVIGDQFTVTVVVASSIPVNVFAGAIVI